MKKTKKAIRELSRIANKESSLKELAIEHLEREGFKRISIKKWGYKINTGGITQASVEVTFDREDKVTVECFLRGKAVKENMVLGTVNELDDVISELVQKVKE
jgi:hypothetical protein